MPESTTSTTTHRSTTTTAAAAASAGARAEERSLYPTVDSTEEALREVDLAPSVEEVMSAAPIRNNDFLAMLVTVNGNDNSRRRRRRSNRNRNHNHNHNETLPHQQQQQQQQRETSNGSTTIHSLNGGTTSSTATNASRDDNLNNNNQQQHQQQQQSQSSAAAPLETAPVELAPPVDENAVHNSTNNNNNYNQHQHQQLETASVDNAVNAAIVPNVVDATDIAVVMSEQEEERMLNKRRKKALCIGSSICIAMAICIIVPIVMLGRDAAADKNEDVVVIVVTPAPTLRPSPLPTAVPSQSPTPESFSQLLDFLQDRTAHLYATTTTTEEGLDHEQNWWLDPSSDPYQAAVWLHSDQANNYYSEAQILQRFALATFFFATGGATDEWQNCGSSSVSCGAEFWLTQGTSECTWNYLTCEPRRRMMEEDNDNNVDVDVITSINVRAAPDGNGLRGTLPPELSLLTELEGFSASNNHLYGKIDPAFQNITTLTTLNLNGNDYTGMLPVDVFTHNPNLTWVYLGMNQFNNTIPNELLRLPQLLELHLYNCELSGQIPAEIGSLNSSILQLQLQNNALTGTLPTQLYALTELRGLYLSNNALSGRLDETLFPQLTNLRDFSAGYTRLSGSIPEAIFASLTSMTQWKVEHAEFRGTLSEQVALWNQTLSTLWLHYNQFVGSLPQALDHLTALSELKLEFNQFRGTISDEICAERGDRFQELDVLTVDCAFVECSCCDEYNCR